MDQTRFPFVLGKANVLVEGSDVTIIATGHMVWKAIEAAEILRERGVHAEVINIHTIKPLDEEAVLASVQKTGCVVTAEEHNMFGGLGEAVARVLSLNYPAPQEFIAVNDTFGESGTPTELLTKYGLDTPQMVAAAETAVRRKTTK
jgi:transketolase